MEVTIPANGADGPITTATLFACDDFIAEPSMTLYFTPAVGLTKKEVRRLIAEELYKVGVLSFRLDGKLIDVVEEVWQG